MNLNLSAESLLARAEELVKETQSVDELRRMVAVCLVLKQGKKLSLQEIALVVGRSASWVAKTRDDYLRVGTTVKENSHGGRRSELIPLEEEDDLMEEACEKYLSVARSRYWTYGYKSADVKVVRFVQRMLEERTGRSVSTSTAYAFMARVGKRKFPVYYAQFWSRYIFDKHPWNLK